MTMSSAVSKVTLNGDGVQTSFPFSFKVWKATDLEISITNAAGVTTVVSNWSVSLAGTGGTVTYPTSGPALPSGHKITIARSMDFLQDVDLVSGTRWDPEVVETALDRATAERQQLKEKLDRAVVVDIAATTTPEALLESIYAARDTAVDNAASALDSAERAEIAATTVAYYNHEGVLTTGQDTIALPWAYDTDVGVEVFLSGVKQAESSLTFVDAYTVTLDTPVSADTPFEVTASSGARSDLANLLASSAGSALVGFVQDGTGAVARTVQDKMREIVSVKDFGAVGDGVTDDTAFFNAAPSGFVYVPGGTYRLAGWVPKNNTTYLFASDAVLVQHQDANPIVAFADGAKNITFIGGTFNGRATSSAGAFSIFDKQGSNFRNDILLDGCTFDTFGGMALVLGGAKGWRIRGCIFRRTAQLNIPSGTASYPSIWCSDNQNLSFYDRASDIAIDGCVFEDTYWSGVYALGQRISIRDCQFRNTRESAIFISKFASHISVTGNDIDTTTMQNISASGVEVGGEFITVVGNRVTNCGAYGISVQDAIFFNVTGNLVSFNQVGIGVITSSDAHPPRYGAVKANTISNSTAQGLYISLVGSGAVIADCDFSDNHITTSSGRDIDFSHSTGLVSANTAIARNTTLAKGKSVVSVNLQSLTVGTGLVLCTVPFRPASLQITCINPGSNSRMSVGAVEFNATGSITQGSHAVTESGASLSASAISLPSIFVASVTSVSFNTTSGLWEVLCSVTTNAGVAAWALITATP